MNYPSPSVEQSRGLPTSASSSNRADGFPVHGFRPAYPFAGNGIIHHRRKRNQPHLSKLSRMYPEHKDFQSPPLCLKAPSPDISIKLSERSLHSAALEIVPPTPDNRVDGLNNYLKALRLPSFVSPAVSGCGCRCGNSAQCFAAFDGYAGIPSEKISTGTRIVLSHFSFV